MLKKTLATVAVTALSAPAFAGGLAAPVAEPVVTVPVASVASPSRDWSGFYVGVHGGTADFEAAWSRSSSTMSGNYYGIHAGYMHDFGQIVAGGELRYSDVSNIAGADTMVSVRARLGYDLGRVLPYIAAGYGQLSTTNWGSDSGPQYGLGVEFAVTDRWRLGVEYTHFEYKDFNGFPVDLSGNAIGIRASFRF